MTAVGDNEYGQCLVREWEHIAAVAAGWGHSLGLRLDGKVYAVGDNEYGQCEVENWEDIISIACGSSSSYGLKKDGTIVVTGRASYMHDEIAKLNNIKAIATVYEYLIALDHDGVVHFTSDAFLNEGEIPEITGWDDVTHLSWGEMNGMNLIGLTENGSIRRVKIKDSRFEHFEALENWKDIQQISTLTPVVAVNESGRVVCKDNINIDPQNHEEMKKVVSTWTDMVSVTSVFNFSGIHIIGLKNDGTIIQYRQNHGNSTPEEMKNLEQIQIMNIGNENLIGKMKDGNYVSYGMDYSISDDFMKPTYSSVENAQSIIGSDAALTDDGQLIMFESSYSVGDRIILTDFGVADAIELWNGSYNGGALTRGYAVLKDDQNVEIIVYKQRAELEGNTPNLIYGNAKSAETWENVVQIIDLGSGMICGLHEDGTISTTDAEKQDRLKNERGMKKIVGKGELLLGIREDNSVTVLLSDEQSVKSGKTQVDRWIDIQDIAIGGSHVVGLRTDGAVVAAGGNLIGQCDVEDWENIVSITAGNNCTLGITADGELKFAGMFY